MDDPHVLRPRTAKHTFVPIADGGPMARAPMGVRGFHVADGVAKGDGGDAGEHEGLLMGTVTIHLGGRGHPRTINWLATWMDNRMVPR